MTGERLRSIVPMFGGGTRYVDTLNSILEYVDANQPTTDELIGWHRGTFENVTSRDSIMRRVRYLEQIGFLRKEEGAWTLGRHGEQYADGHDLSTLLRIMCDRNVGLRSLLYALTVGPMTIEDISDQQLDTHPELGWSRGETDMAHQRANWLRSMGLVQKRGERYELTGEGKRFVGDAVEAWANQAQSSSDPDEAFSAGTYQTVSYARVIDPEFRATVLSRFDYTCPVSGVDHPALVDVAHVLPWSDYPDYRSDLSNVLPLSKIHHAAFDRHLFTIDAGYRLQVNPSFETKSDLLQQTIVDRDGERVPLLENSVDPDHLRRHNALVGWC